MEYTREYLDARFRDMKDAISSYESAYKDIQKYISPTRGMFSGQQPNWGSAIDHKTILDGHAMLAERTLSAGLMSGLTSPSRPWFKLSLKDQELMKYKPVSLWLDESTEILRTIFSRSNFYGSASNIYKEACSFGTACSIMLEDYQEVIRMRDFTCGEYRLSNDAKGRVCAMSREFSMTVKQLVDEFGYENCSTSAKSLYDQHKLEQYVQVNHLVEKNKGYKEETLGHEGMEYISIYWESSSKDEKFLATKGFKRNPIIAPRWGATKTTDVYGKESPAWLCIGDIKQLMKLQKDKLMGLDKQVNPPVQGSSDVLGGINVFPGGVTRFSSTNQGAGVRPIYQVDLNLQMLQMVVNETKSAIDRFYFVDLFRMMSDIDRSNVTAREIVEKQGEKVIQLSPVLDSFQNEFLDPAIDNAFQIAMDSNQLPPTPPELEGMDLDVEYTSIFAQAQKMLQTSTIEQTVAFIGNMAAVYPEVIDVIDPDAAATEYAKATGLDAKILRSKDEVSSMRKAKADKQAQMEQQQQAANLVQGAKVMSETPVGSGSTLLDGVLGLGK